MSSVRQGLFPSRLSRSPSPAVNNGQASSNSVTGKDPDLDGIAPLPGTSPPRHSNVQSRGADPEACLEVFKSHWQQVLSLLTGDGRSSMDNTEAVLRYVDQMALLLVEEGPAEDGHAQGPILDFLLTEDILERILTWASGLSGEQAERARHHQLKLYELIIGQARQQLLMHKPIMRPLLKLLGSCRDIKNSEVERHLILILHQLCVAVTKHTQVLELLFDGTADHGPAKFLMFSLLIPYIHREGAVGQQARDALLLIMALSSQQDDIGRHITNNSDFCPVSTRVSSYVVLLKVHNQLYRTGKLKYDYIIPVGINLSYNSCLSMHIFTYNVNQV